MGLFTTTEITIFIKLTQIIWSVIASEFILLSPYFANQFSLEKMASEVWRN